jgi:hypothetical protein
MAKTEAISEVFWQAFQSLPAAERRAIIDRLLQDERFREELLDISVILERSNEPSRPYEDFADELQREGRL